MVYKQQPIGLILRLIIIFVMMMCIPLTVKFVEPNQLIFTYLVISIILVSLTIELYMFLNRTLRELTRFLQNILNRDFTLRFNEKGTRGARRNLYRTFNEVLEIYRDIRIEKEVQFRFLEHIIELIEVGIIVFNQQGKVVLANTAAGNYTGVPSPLSWDQITRKNTAFGASVGSLDKSNHVLFESGSLGIPYRLAIQVSRTRMLEETYSLMAIQDIKGMVEHKETGAWIRLLRTLNHEIKNSVTPISSLADTIMMILQDETGQFKTVEQIDPQNLEDIITSTETLQQRSKSLHSFIDEYHKLTRISAPNPESILCDTLFNDTAAFFKSKLGQNSIKLTVDLQDDTQEIWADRGLIDQVLINLVKNSIDAFQDKTNPQINLRCEHSQGKVILSVSDNGNGIEEDLLEDIFVPFFSTKSDGSGIGLSLVRQIMRLHGGNVHITSKLDQGTVVSLSFLAPP